MATAFYPTLFQHLATDYQRNLSVTAGAGTGKTEVLTRRIINILAREKYFLDRLLVLTFTDKAAVEMKERIYTAIDRELAATGAPHFQKLKDSFLNNYISTFHAFCAALLREYPIEAGIDPSLRVLDETETLFFLRRSITRSLRELAADRENSHIRILSEEFSRGALSSAIFTIIQKREDTGAWIRDFNGLEWDAYRRRLGEYRNCMLEEMCYKLVSSDRPGRQLQKLHELEKVLPTGDSSALNRRRKRLTELLPQFLEEAARWIPAAAAEGQQQGQVRGDSGAGQAAAAAGVETQRLAALKKEILEQANLTGKAPENWPDQAYATLRNVFYSLRYLMEAFPIEEFEIVEEHEIAGFEMLKALAQLVRYCLQRFHDDKAAENYLDFQDLQLKVMHLLENEKHCHVLEELRERFSFIMVDEFQDTNDLQWKIIRKIASDRSETIVSPRVFVVGDEKQAIYSFRGGDVRLFSRVRRELMEANRSNRLHLFPYSLRLNREKDYTSEYGKQLKDDKTERAGEIVFADNFRSASVPVKFFNMFFHDLLAKNIYEEYDAKPQKLLCSGNKNSGSVELMLVNSAKKSRAAVDFLPGKGTDASGSDSGMDLNPHFKEALLIADKIKEVFLGDDDKYSRVRESARQGRPAVAILLNRRTMIKTYEEALRMSRIDFTVVRGRGFFQRQEVVDLGNLLSFLNDPAAELSLLAFLRSPVGHVSDEGIFLLEKTGKGETLWEKLVNYAGSVAAPANNVDPADPAGPAFSLQDREALLNCQRNLSRWLSLSGRMTLMEFLRQVLQDGGYELSLSRGKRGEQAISNIEKLLDSARDLELQGGGNLADFADWLNNRIDFIEEEGEADIDISLGGAVQIMTVHQSKGLEFPMVFVPDLGAGFNFGERESLFADHLPYKMEFAGDRITRKELPEIGLNAPNPENQWESEPILIKRIIKARRRDKITAEKKRLFYVAATRAMDHLVLVGHADFFNQRLLQRLLYMPQELITNWMDWLNMLLGISFKLEDVRGELLYENKAGEQMKIPYRLFSEESSLMDSGMEYRTEF